MKRFLAVVAYDGTDYAGFQKQPHHLTIQGEIEKAFSRFLHTPTVIHGSGRTDAGVHAIGQTFHFDAPDDFRPEDGRYHLNCMLPPTIHIQRISEVDLQFHARLSARAKTYEYHLNMSESDPLKIRYCYQFKRSLDIKRMEDAAALLVGTHCFHNFTTKREDDRGFIRTLFKSEVKVDHPIVTFTFQGNGFLRAMVRMLVGTLIEVGLGRLEIEALQNLLASSKRQVVAHKAPPEGLYLVRVEYEEH